MNKELVSTTYLPKLKWKLKITLKLRNQSLPKLLTSCYHKDGDKQIIVKFLRFSYTREKSERLTSEAFKKNSQPNIFQWQ